ncbi:MAG: tetratricopeptide repeat protein [Acidobacteria bacterium]|nr:tetratricopeptide repeat protein [Acidobacteriota bacterium]
MKKQRRNSDHSRPAQHWTLQRPLLSFCVLAAIWVYLLYSALLDAPFVYDDLDQIANNPALQSWHATWTHFILAPVSFTSGFIGSGGSTYRPLFWISLAIDRHLWGTDAGGFHLTSIVLHWINGLLLFQLLRKLNLSLVVAGLTALVWLGLPINSEAVAWVSARAYLLSTACILAALLAALSYLRSLSRLALPAFLAFALMADFSHEQGVLLAGFLTLAYLLENPTLTQNPTRTQRWLLLGAAALLADAVYFACSSAVGAHAGHGDRTLWSVGLKFWTYLQLICLPVHMSMERSSAVPANTPSISAIIAWAALIGLIAAAIHLRRRTPAIAAGLAILLLGLLPYCGFVYIYQGMAERFAYLAAIGFVLALIAAAILVHPRQQQVLLGCVALWALWGAWRLVTRVHNWQQPLALYQNSLAATPQSAYLRKNLGDVYLSQGNPRSALAEYTHSLALAPNNPKTILNDASALQQAGDNARAEVQYRRVIQLLPHESAAYVDLESLYIEQGRLQDAIAMYKQAISINPSDSNAYFDMGVMFQQHGQNRDALAFYRKVLQLKPGDPQTLLYLSKLPLATTGNDQ